MKTGPNIRKRNDGRFEARYEKGRDSTGRIIYGFAYGATFEEAYLKRHQVMIEAGLPIPDRYILLSGSEVEPELMQDIINEINEKEDPDKEYMDGPEDYLGEEQAIYFDEVLRQKRVTRWAAVYVCLHMGLTQTEVSKLRYSDFDLDNKLVNVISDDDKNNVRTVPIPSHVESYLLSVGNKYPSPDCYLVSGMPYKEPPVYIVNSALGNINKVYKISKSLNAVTLRNTFVKRLLDCGVSIATISELTGVKPLEKFVKRFGCLFEVNTGEIELLSKYVAKSKPEFYPITDSGKRMNLLILGAGGEGHVVKETAEAMGVFKEIAFLDDNKKGPDILGTVEDAKLFVERFPIAFVGIGANPTRRLLVDYLENLGFIMPVLIHPSASVSTSAKLSAPCIVEAKAIINMGVAVGRGAIISSGSILDRDAVVGEFSHIDVGVTVEKSSVVPNEFKLTSGMHWRGEESAM